MTPEQVEAFLVQGHRKPGRRFPQQEIQFAGRTALKVLHVDVETFKPRAGAKARIAAELGIGDAIPIVGVVGRFHTDKDFANVINAEALLSVRGHEFHLVLVGPGVDHSKGSFTEAFHSSALQKRVTLLERRDDVAESMAGFDILCSCSASHAFPNLIGEAMASGVPCVVTDVGDSALIVGSTGIVVPPQNPEALAHGLSQLLALDPERRRQLGLAARWRIIDHFSTREDPRRIG